MGSNPIASTIDQRQRSEDLFFVFMTLYMVKSKYKRNIYLGGKSGGQTPNHIKIVT